jgi:hypothetical protein
MLDDDDPRDAWLMTADTLVHLNLRCVVEVREEEYCEPRLLIFHDDLGRRTCAASGRSTASTRRRADRTHRASRQHTRSFPWTTLTR